MACYKHLILFWIMGLLIGVAKIIDSSTSEETKSFWNNEKLHDEIDDQNTIIEEQFETDTQTFPATRTVDISWPSSILEKSNSSITYFIQFTPTSVSSSTNINEISSSFNNLLYNTRDITNFYETHDHKTTINHSNLSSATTETIVAFDPVQLTGFFHGMSLEAAPNQELCDEENDTNSENDAYEKGQEDTGSNIYDGVSRINRMKKSTRRLHCRQTSILSQMSTHDDFNILTQSDIIPSSHIDIIHFPSDSLFPLQVEPSYTLDNDIIMPAMDHHYEEDSHEIPDMVPNLLHPERIPDIIIDQGNEHNLNPSTSILSISNYSSSTSGVLLIDTSISYNPIPTTSESFLLNLLPSSTIQPTPTTLLNSNSYEIITSVDLQTEAIKFPVLTTYSDISPNSWSTMSYVKPVNKKMDHSPNSHDKAQDSKDEFPIKFVIPTLHPTKAFPKSPGPDESPPSLYLSIALNMIWMEFCEQKEDFQRIIAHIIEYSSQIRINPKQVVLFNIENNCLLQDSYGPKIMVDICMVNELGQYDYEFTQEVFRMIVEEVKIIVNTPFHDKFIAIHINGKQNYPDAQSSSSYTSSGIIAAIAVSCIAAMVLIAIIAVQYLWKKKHWSSTHFNKKRCTPAKDTRSMDLISVRSSIRMKKFQRSKLRRSYVNRGYDDPDAPSRTLNMNSLTALSKNTEALDEEFKKIPMNMPKIDELPVETEDKNRYANVIPIAETRVSLSILQGEPNSDYINANFMRGYKNKEKAYIACQAPMNNTIHDFWRMVLECKCQAIIMLTAFEEQGLSRCSRYFSISETLDSTLIFGNIHVTTKKKDMKEHFVVTYLEVNNTDTKENLKITHYWFNTWPVQGMPEDPFSVIRFLLEARLALIKSQGPPIFHCSAGTGRTGVALACDICMREYEESQTVNILNCVFKLRQDRGGAVQTKEQYQFIYKALSEYSVWLQNQTMFVNDSARASISSENQM